jgi:uncharacterized membrane protein YgdD (TMEM256/DUF423 family)
MSLVQRHTALRTAARRPGILGADRRTGGTALATGGGQTMSGTTWLRLGAILGGLAVAAGAFAAHGLEGRLSERGLALFETAARYQMYHALAMVAVGLLAGSARPGRALGVAGWSFSLGILLFSGSLYALALSGVRWLGAITPIGGVLFLVGWAALAAHRPGPDTKPIGAHET